MSIILYEGTTYAEIYEKEFTYWPWGKLVREVIDYVTKIRYTIPANLMGFSIQDGEKPHGENRTVILGTPEHMLMLTSRMTPVLAEPIRRFYSEGK